MTAVLTEASRQALSNLRDPSHFGWYLIPLLAFVVYVYATAAENGRWNVFVTGLAFLGAEFAWEMFNALILHASDRSAMWTTPGDTAYLMLVGLTIEIAMMFSVAGVIFTRALPEDPAKKVLRLPNRLVYALGFGLGCVAVEVVLNRWGALVWEYPWWRWPNVWLIILAYAFGFYLCAWFFDLKLSIKNKAALAAAVFAFDIACFVVFASVLEWI